MIFIDLKVPAYLKSYLTSLYGTSYKVSFSDELGVLILSCLQKKNLHTSITALKDPSLQTYQIAISMSYFEKEGCHIYEKTRNLICKTIDFWFRNQLYRIAVINYESFNIPYKDTIEQYLRRFNIDEDQLSYGTIRKDFNRKKENIKKMMWSK